MNEMTNEWNIKLNDDQSDELTNELSYCGPGMAESLNAYHKLYTFSFTFYFQPAGKSLLSPSLLQQLDPQQLDAQQMEADTSTGYVPANPFLLKEICLALILPCLVLFL